MHTYRIKQSFDYVQIQMQCDNGGCCGVVIPKFEEVNSGTENLIYAIDFGTTNTHVAYTRSGTVDSHSFSSNEIQHQVAYLNKYRSDAPNMSCGRENAEFLLNRRRRFFPQANEGAYTFPIRSVTYEPKGLDNSSNLFSDGAIGFHITKDITSEGYEPKLKWAFEESVMPTERRKRIDFFFEEILWMVKNHWFKHPATNKGNRPEIVITYPQVMMNRQRMMDKWIEIYGRVFDCDQDAATQKIKELVESFAPCCQLISNGTAVTTGLLNIDIGGATTDLQYYRKSVGAVGLDEVSRYASVLFAGDDLWGVGYENVPECITNNNKNNFTTAAQKVLKDVIFNLEDMDDHASDKGIHEIINDDIPVKQQINKLLQDLHRNFTTWLSDNTTNVCRQTLFLHYSAIVYYVGLWIRDNTSMSLPATLNFTGMGAKYITLLFQNNELLTRFTRTILERVVGEKFNDGFSLDFDKNPKNVTAEGASAYFAVKKDFAENKVAYHAGGKTVRKPMVSDLKGREEETMAAFEAFVNLYQDLPGEIGGVTIPKLRGADKERLISNGRISLGEMITKMNERAKDSPEAKISDTMFFWPLKGSLYNLGN